MTLSDHDKWVIEQYEADEEMMVLIFAQWCVNHQLDPVQLYEEAYPNQQANKLLQQVLEKTTEKNEAVDISKEVVLHVMLEVGNDDLAFGVQAQAETIHNKKSDWLAITVNATKVIYNPCSLLNFNKA